MRKVGEFIKPEGTHTTSRQLVNTNAKEKGVWALILTHVMYNISSSNVALKPNSCKGQNFYVICDTCLDNL